MIIDHIDPKVVGAKSTLRQLLLDKWIANGRSAELSNNDLAAIPRPLVDAEAFFDRRTGYWRYEFGAPFSLGEELVFGTHMWIPVDHFELAIRTVLARVPVAKRSPYLARLNDRWSHWDTLVEMMPGHRLTRTAAADFEVDGVGVGNKTIDWVAEFEDRAVRLDVKSRSTDFLKQAEQKDVNGFMPEPLHDPGLMFRSVQGKFVAADPATVLQGAWIVTHIKQNKVELARAFAALDEHLVHFAFFGDWESDVNLLVKPNVDQDFLLRMFTAVQSDRFTFDP